MHIISRDAPCFYLTSVAKDRLPVFRSDKIKLVTCEALDEARKSGGFALYAYVIMLDHLHVISDSACTSADTLRFINGIVGRVIDYLKEENYESSLRKLQQELKPRRYQYSLWDHHPNVRLLLSESMLMQRVHYTLIRNPVRAGLVERAEDYRCSSIRCWTGKTLPDEPLLMDLDRIKWRSR